MPQFLNMFLIGIGLSMDAFAVSVCKGLASKRVNWVRALVTALSFGLFQAFMPVLGWLLGESVQAIIEPIDHWIAFVLLSAIGGKMIWDAFHDDSSCDDVADETPQHFLVELLLLSIATSIDAFVAGITFSMAGIPVAEAALVIGVTTFLLSFSGFAIGNRFGAAFERPATILGGVALILLGVKVLLEHLLA